MANVRSNNMAESLPARRIMPDRKAKHGKSATEITAQSSSLAAMMKKSSIPTPVKVTTARRITTAPTIQSPLALNHQATSSKRIPQPATTAGSSRSKTATLKSINSEPIAIPVTKTKTTRRAKAVAFVEPQNSPSVSNSSIPVPRSAVKNSRKIIKSPVAAAPEPPSVKKTRSRTTKLAEIKSEAVQSATSALKSAETAGTIRKTRSALKSVVEPSATLPKASTSQAAAEKKGRAPVKSKLSKKVEKTEVHKSPEKKVTAKSKSNKKVAKLAVIPESPKQEVQAQPPSTLPPALSDVFEFKKDNFELPPTVATRRRRAVQVKSPSKKVAEVKKITRTVKTKNFKALQKIPPSVEDVNESPIIDQTAITACLDVQPITGDEQLLFLPPPTVAKSKVIHTPIQKKNDEVIDETDFEVPNDSNFVEQTVPEHFDAPAQLEQLNFLAPTKSKVVHTPVQKKSDPFQFDTFKTPKQKGSDGSDDERRHSKVWHSPILNSSNASEDSPIHTGKVEEANVNQSSVQCPRSPPIASNYAKTVAANAVVYQLKRKPLPSAQYQIGSTDELFAETSGVSDGRMMLARRNLEDSLNDSNAENNEPENYMKKTLKASSGRAPLESIPVVPDDDSFAEDTLEMSLRAFDEATARQLKKGAIGRIQTSTPMLAVKRKQAAVMHDKKVS